MNQDMKDTIAELTWNYEHNLDQLRNIIYRLENKILALETTVKEHREYINAVEDNRITEQRARAYEARNCKDCD